MTHYGALALRLLILAVLSIVAAPIIVGAAVDTPSSLVMSADSGRRPRRGGGR
jgi:hypothetical protein